MHVVTVNDYLARRDAEWMGRVHRFLGLTVGCVLHDLSDKQRQEAYRADITYGQNNEFGFDYLRDNMKFRLQDYVQRELNFAIVDEVDSILIDEARTPLIISGPTEDTTDKYYRVDQVIPGLVPDQDYTLDEKAQVGDPHRRAASRSSRSGSTSATSTIRRRSRRSTTWSRPCAPTRSTSATATTWCATARSSSSTSSPAA